MKRTEIGTIGEFGLIDRITANYSAKQKSTVYGIGDDAAVIDNSNHQTVDTKANHDFPRNFESIFR